MTPRNFAQVGVVLAVLVVLGETLAPHTNWVVLLIAVAACVALVERATAPVGSYQQPDPRLNCRKVHRPYDWSKDPEVARRGQPVS